MTSPDTQLPPMKDATKIGDIGLRPKVEKTGPIQPDPRTPQPPPLERASRRVQGWLDLLANQKKLTRKEAIAGAGLITLSVTTGIGLAVATKENSGKSTLPAAESIHQDMTGTGPEHVPFIDGKRLSLGEIIDIVSSQEKVDTSVIQDRINDYNDLHPNHMITTLIQGEKGLEKSDKGVLGIFRMTGPSINVRSSPDAETNDNLVGTLNSSADINGVTDDGYFMGFLLEGRRFLGASEGNLMTHDQDRNPEFFGLWVGMARGENQDGQWRAYPEDRVLPSADEPGPRIPSLAKINIQSVSINAAKAALHP